MMSNKQGICSPPGGKIIPGQSLRLHSSEKKRQQFWLIFLIQTDIFPLQLAYVEKEHQVSKVLMNGTTLCI